MHLSQIDRYLIVIVSKKKGKSDSGGRLLTYLTKLQDTEPVEIKT